MNENCTITITNIDGVEETFNVTDINQPDYRSCLNPEEFAHRVAEYGITIESLDGNGNKLVRYIKCVCEVNVLCPC